MATIPIEAEISTEQLRRAVEQLPPQEFSSPMDHLLALRAQREAPHLSQAETALLLQINKGMAAEMQRRFDSLVAKRRAESITPQELDDLIVMTDQIERHDAQRLAAIQDDALLLSREGVVNLRRILYAHGEHAPKAPIYVELVSLLLLPPWLVKS